MTTVIRTLLAASAAAALLASPAARAHDRDDPGRYQPAPKWAPTFQGPTAEPCPPPPAPVAPSGWVPGIQGRWQALRAEYQRLELARSDFYARWHGNPWAQRRFETWYAARRADLDRRAGMLPARPGARPPGLAWADPRFGEWRPVVRHDRGHDRDDD
jgi:hypothetical protein